MKDRCIRGHKLTEKTRIRKFINGTWRVNGCKVCAIARSKKWYQDNREKEALRSRQSYLLHRDARREKVREYKCLTKHGITLQQRNQILEQQGHCCANPGCRRELPKNGGHLDHNHKTGTHRGILCAQCNLVLGLVQDACERLSGLVEYLQKAEYNTAVPSVEE